MKKIITALCILGLFGSTSVMAHNPRDQYVIRPCMNCAARANQTHTNYVFVEEKKDTTPYIIGGLIAGVVIGYIIFGEPRDVTRATVRF